MRLDKYLVEEAYYESRNRALDAIKAGKVKVDGKTVKPSVKVDVNKNSAGRANNKEPTINSTSVQKENLCCFSKCSLNSRDICIKKPCSCTLVKNNPNFVYFNTNPI